MSENARVNKAVDRAVDILDYVARQGREVTMAEISRELKIPKSSAFDILHTLARRKMLQMNEANKTFKLDIHAFEIGSRFLGNSEVHIVARPVLKNISMQTGETTFLAVENNGMIVYLEKVEGSSPTRTTCNLGDRNTMYSTGLGKAILSTKSIEQVRMVTGGGELLPKTKNTKRHFNELMEDLEEIRRRGYSIDNREDVEHVYCVSAPILNADAECVASISLSTFYTPNTEKQEPVYRDLVLNGALEISHRFGFMGDDLYPVKTYNL